MSVWRASEVGTRIGFCKLLVRMADNSTNELSAQYSEELGRYIKHIPILEIGKKYDLKVTTTETDGLTTNIGIEIPEEFREKNTPKSISLSVSVQDYNLKFNIRELKKK